MKNNLESSIFSGLEKKKKRLVSSIFKAFIYKNETKKRDLKTDQCSFWLKGFSLPQICKTY